MAAALNNPNNNNNNNMELNMEAPPNNNYTDDLHEIFPQRHEFGDPLTNPKILVDSCYAKAAPSKSLNKLVGRARFYATKCMKNDIIQKAGVVRLPPHLNIERCLHPDQQTMNPQICMRKLLATKNPRSYILATITNLNLAETVVGLPLISFDENAEAKFRQPSQNQVDYALTTAPAVILRNKQAEQTSMMNYLEKLRKRKKKN